MDTFFRLLPYGTAALIGAFAMFFWLGSMKPISTIAECERYALEFKARPTYQLGFTTLGCEFQERDIQPNQRRPLPDQRT